MLGTGEVDTTPARRAIRDFTLAEENALVGDLLGRVGLDADARDTIGSQARHLVEGARRRIARGGMIEQFLQEYGLNNDEGIALMRLAEAMLRTPDALTADALIRDKVSAAAWAAHRGHSPSPLVNLSTRGLSAAAAWLDRSAPPDPALPVRRVVQRLAEPIVRTAVAQAMRILGDHFVLGQTMPAAMARARPFAARGYRLSYDMLGEAALTRGQADRYLRAYADAIAAVAGIAEPGMVARNPGISVKLSALHPRYVPGQRVDVLSTLLPALRRLVAAAHAADIAITIDAEEADRLELSLDLFDALLADPETRGWPGLGFVVQAYQRRALPVIDWLIARARATGRRIMVRLVKGAYWDSEIKRAQEQGLDDYPVFTRKACTDVSYLACARRLFDHPDAVYPQFATHNAHTIAAILHMAGDNGDFELQRLHGMGEPLHDAVVEQGQAVSRIYAPVGGHRDLLPYLVRRLLENGANSSFINQLFDPALAVDDVVGDPIAELAHAPCRRNPRIPMPRDILDGERLGAGGIDLANPAAVARLAMALDGRPDAGATSIIAGRDRTGSPRPVTSPADRRVLVGHVTEATTTMVDEAVSVAADHWPAWAGRAAGDRANTLRSAADALEDDRDAFIDLAIREAGKTPADAVAEVREAADFCRYYADRAADPRMQDRQALGPIACISPWNFPLAIFLGQVSAALVTGNAAIAKPAPQTPLIAARAVRLLHAAGVPPEVLALLPGDGQIGGALVADPRIAGVLFTGSTATAQAIHRAIAQTSDSAPLIAETGGVNAMIVDSTALPEQAVRDALASAFQSAGQRCSALRLLCVQEDIADGFLEILAGAMAELRVGDPASLATDVGPVIDAAAHRRIDDHVADLDRRFRRIATAPLSSGCEHGTYAAPVAFELNSVDDLAEEVFGPVLHIVRYRARDLEALVQRINAAGYGLTMGLHSRIDETMRRVRDTARVGNLYINRNQIGAVVGVQPFGGEGLSGTGPKAGGPHYLERLTRPGPAPEAMPADRGGVAVIGAPPPAWDPSAARAAQRTWASQDRMAALRRAVDQTACAMPDLSGLDEPAQLPGPAGEHNTLTLSGRGIALCLGPDGWLDRQVLRALATGNAVLAAVTPSAQAAADTLRTVLEASGAPADLLQLVAIDDGRLPADLLMSADIDAVCADLDPPAQAAIRQTLAQRRGTIVPLVRCQDPIARLTVERTLTINTAAAGGDAQLLATA